MSSRAAIDVALSRISALHRRKRDVEKFKTIPGVDAVELETLNTTIQIALDQIEIIRNKRPSFFRRQNRQWS